MHKYMLHLTLYISNDDFEHDDFASAIFYSHNLLFTLRHLIIYVPCLLVPDVMLISYEIALCTLHPVSFMCMT